MMCSGRVDMSFIFRAFANGNDGVFVGTCHLGDCHYVTHGNYDALNMVMLSKKILAHLGLNPERIKLEHVSAGEGLRFAEAMNEFSQTMKNLGLLGQSEGIDQDVLKLKLQTVNELIPYIRVVQNERLKVRFDTVEQYEEFYASKELEKIFNELIGDKLTLGQIISLLREKPLAPGEMAAILGLTSSEVSRQLNSSAMQGLVKYEESQKCFALA